MFRHGKLCNNFTVINFLFSAKEMVFFATSTPPGRYKRRLGPGPDIAIAEQAIAKVGWLLETYKTT